jgi:hypothetical protein
VERYNFPRNKNFYCYNSVAGGYLETGNELTQHKVNHIYDVWLP